jgi:hypothetical protein
LPGGNTSLGIGLTATAIQPSPPVPGEPPAGPPFQPADRPGELLAAPRTDQQKRAARRDRAEQLTEGIPGQGQVAMTATEAKLNHYLAQCPEPFLFYSQVPFSFLRRVRLFLRGAASPAGAPEFV